MRKSFVILLPIFVSVLNFGCTNQNNSVEKNHEPEVNNNAPPRLSMVTFQQNLLCRQTDPSTGNANVPCQSGCENNNKLEKIQVASVKSYYHNFQPGQNDNTLNIIYTTSDDNKTTLNCKDSGKVNGFDGHSKKDGREIYGTRNINLAFSTLNNRKYSVKIDYTFLKDIQSAGPNGISSFDIVYIAKIYKGGNLILSPETIIEGSNQIVFNIQGKDNYSIEISAQSISAKVIDYGSPREFSSNLSCEISFLRLP